MLTDYHIDPNDDAVFALNDSAMPLAAPFPSPQANNTQPPSNALYPALYLYPLNDTWAPKHITLSNQHTKIGRQTSSKTAPGERNGFFDSKVLSRQHAEVWEENGKVGALPLVVVQAFISPYTKDIYKGCEEL